MSGFISSLKEATILGISVYSIISTILLCVLCFVTIAIFMSVVDKLQKKSKADPAGKGFAR